MTPPELPPERPAARWRSRLWLLVKVGVAAALITAVVRNPKFSSEQLLAAVATPWFAATLVLGGCAVSLSGLRWGLLLRSEGIRLPVAQVLRLTWIGHFWNMVIPGAVSGDLVKMAYVGRAAPEQREEAWTTVLADRVIGLTSLVSLSVLAALARFELVWERPELRGAFLTMLAVLACVGCGWLVLTTGLASRLLPRSGRLVQRLNLAAPLERGEAALGRIARRPGSLATAFGLSFGVHLLAVACCLLLGHALGEQGLSAGEYAVVVPVALFTNAIPISPGGLGVGEVVLGKLFVWSGGRMADGSAVMLLWRLMNYGPALIGGALDLAQRQSVAPAVEAPVPQPQVQE